MKQMPRMLNAAFHKYDNVIRAVEARQGRSRMRDDPARQRWDMTAPNGAPLPKLRLHPRLSPCAPALRDRP